MSSTGKTTHTEYLIRLLKSKYRIAVLSRGYKRKTSGFVLADAASTSRQIGDEPYQIKQKFPDIIVAVDASRRHGIEQLLALPESARPELILLDDAYQHRYVQPSFSVVLTDFNRLYYEDKLLPTGRLREPAHGIERSDVVIVTKCPEEIKPIEFRIIEENMKLKAHQQLFFTRIGYDDIRPVFPEVAKPRSLNDLGKEEEVLILSGIASPDLFVKEIRRYTDKIQVLSYPDHHNFSKSDIQHIDARFQALSGTDALIITTEKDAARLKTDPKVPGSWKSQLYYLPIDIRFHGKQGFDELIQKHIHHFRRNNILRNKL